MSEYPWLRLSEIRKYEHEMERLGVSEVARSWRGFLTEYKRVGGRRDRMSLWWQRRRDGFIARHLVQFNIHPTLRRWLAMVAWAYRPSKLF
jgi:hypothetical protein